MNGAGIMKEEKTRHNYKFVVIGAVFITLTLVIGTIWIGQRARQDTEKAVDSDIIPLEQTHEKTKV
jgi:hypothetical protein